MLSWLVIGSDGHPRRGQPVSPGADAPGDPLLQALPYLPLPDRRTVLCALPDAGAARRNSASQGSWPCWRCGSLMAVAMMLPSAAPMIRTYCEIADTARDQGRGGRASAGACRRLPVSLAGRGVCVCRPDRRPLRAGTCTAARSGSWIAGAAALAIAGLYQFSGLKEACLKKCRNPFAILFAQLERKPVRIFRLGVEQGVWCLGCCWALMLVMFAVGTMNIFWMALIGAVTMVEKQTSAAANTACRRDTACMGAALLLVSGLSA